MIGIPEVATGIVAFLAPYLPHLLDLGKEAGKGVFEGAAKKGGEEAWAKAQSLWNKIRSRSTNSPAIEGAAVALASEPNDGIYRASLIKALTDLLQNHPELTQELVKLMGGEDSVQTVLIYNRSRGREISQNLEGAGKQTVDIHDDSSGTKITQTKK